MTTVKSGGETKVRACKGTFLTGEWQYGGLPVSSLEPGDKMACYVTFRMKRENPQPEKMEFHIHAAVPKGKQLPADPLFKIEGDKVTIGEGEAKGEWEVPTDHEDWPNDLMFVPVAEGLETQKKWVTPQIAVADAWDIRTWWDPPTAAPQQMVTLNTKLHGVPSDKKVTFKLSYRVDQTKIPVKDGELKDIELKRDPDGDMGDTVASVEWQIPTYGDFTKAAEDAGVEVKPDDDTAAEERELEADEGVPPAEGTQLGSPVFTLELEMIVGEGENQIKATSELDVVEPRFFFSM